MQNAPNLNQQQITMQFQYLKEQRDMFAQQLEIINASLGNLINTKTTVENLKNLKEGEEILVPIGGMINIKANIKKPEKVLLYISQDVIIEKDLDPALEFTEKLINQHNEQISFLRTQLQKIEINLQNISQTIQGMMPQQMR